MKDKKLTPDGVWKEYGKGNEYKQGIDLFNIVERNNDFVNDNQWRGVKAKNLDKPVFNIIKPAVNYYQSILMSDAIAVDFGAKVMCDPITGPPRDVQYPPETIADILTYSTLRVFDRANIMDKCRHFLRNASIDGDACFYAYYDPEIKSVNVEVPDSVNVIFADTTTPDVQSQPYIIIAYRRLTNEVKKEAEENGVPHAEVDEIRADSDNNFQNSEYADGSDNYTTVLVRFWKEDGSVHMMKTTQGVVVREDTDTGYEKYPIVWMNWSERKNSYHGVSPVSGRIPNQIFINKVYALSMRYVTNFAYPKLLYDKNKLPQGWNNDVSQAIGVSGPPHDLVFSAFQPPPMDSFGVALADSTMKQTQDLMGASASALGTERPDNTSAIMAQQRAASMPLDIQRQEFHKAVEDLVRIMVDIYSADYGNRYVDMEAGKYNGWFDYSLLNEYEMNLSVDVGAGSYWSEAMYEQTLDTMLQMGMFPDPRLYLEMLPDGRLKDKQKIIAAYDAMNGPLPGSEEYAQLQEQQQMAQMQNPQMPQEGGMPPEPEQPMPEQVMAPPGGMAPPEEMGGGTLPEQELLPPLGEQPMAPPEPVTPEQPMMPIDGQVEMSVQDAPAMLLAMPTLEDAIAAVQKMGMTDEQTNIVIAWLQENWGMRGDVPEQGLNGGAENG